MKDKFGYKLKVDDVVVAFDTSNNATIGLPGTIVTSGSSGVGIQWNDYPDGRLDSFCCPADKYQRVLVKVGTPEYTILWLTAETQWV